MMSEEFRERYQVLGLKIAYYRKRRGYTQEQFAELIGKSWSFVSQIEANNGAKVKGVSLNTLFTIADKLDVPVEKFFTDD
jgi:transcriptional regulator with XRE-family HTH domain